ncbi:hypothetical protein GUJ93_ZPchr0010g9460 [Zizania palustris]|uniref:Uncharacterized protein n=1 Tax=Zizania palustris TaxID=103762 RepID=A0A8J5WFG4_ZIZPA|nr:hypothetical protein GUJ93_ZPchr0010g9460 [Zizania palustris]
MDDLTYEIRNWNCVNYFWTPEKSKPRPKHGPRANKSVTSPSMLLLLRDFIEWIDEKIDLEDWASLMKHHAFNRELNEMRYQRECECEKEFKEEAKHRVKQKHETDRERRCERAHRVHEVGPEAIRKRKYHHCTQ